MESVKETNLYSEVLEKYNYSFGSVYVFKGFVISEINEGETISWENAKLIIDDVTSFFNSNGEDIFYISNRIHSYSVVAADWLKFFKQSYSLKLYCIVSGNEVGTLNSAIEKLFFKKKIKHFKSLFEAVNFVKKDVIEITN
ncbi:MAG: hypothetical protein ACO3VF_08100 [Tamlana sp.]